VPGEDAAAVARMRRAGAILLGKTNTPPGGAGGVADNPVHGRTNNPYALTRLNRGPALYGVACGFADRRGGEAWRTGMSWGVGIP
jgi:amidase